MVKKGILDLTTSEFDELVAKKVKGQRTHEALNRWFAIEVETYHKAMEILASHKSGANQTEVRKLIRASIAWQKERSHPALAEIGKALEADFDSLVKMVGGPMLMPVPMEEAWDSYVSPTKEIMTKVQQELFSKLQAVANVESQYLIS